jgi:hypothetical protein
MPGGLDKLGQNLLQQKGQANFRSEGNQTSRNIYPAIVVSIDDPAEQNRIIARIISLDENGKINGGRDRDVPDSNLPFCVPDMPDHFFIRPLVGEMVYIYLENPSDNSAPRYWRGPITTSKLKLAFQAYDEAVKVFAYTDFYANRKTDDKVAATVVFPERSDVALQGRQDATLILKPRESYLAAGQFQKGTFNPNTESPSFLQLKQFESTAVSGLSTNNQSLLQKFSQANLESTNINLYSPRGKFRGDDIAKFEINADLPSFGSVANLLHPAFFGDEAIKVLNLLIISHLTHIHTSQNPLLPTPESEELKEYTITGKLQNLISNHVRIN